MKMLSRFLSVIAATTTAWFAASAPAQAHPHAFIAVKVAAVFEAGQLKGLRQTWTFDDLYTQQALEGLKPGPGGVFGRKELEALTKANLDGLRDFKYFTTVTLPGGQQAGFATPTDAGMQVVDSKEPPGPDIVMGGDLPPPADAPAAKVLELSFFLPLDRPATIDATGAEVSITDAEIYIWFSFVREAPVSIEGEARCTAGGVAAGRLNDAMSPSGVVDGFKQSTFRITCG